MLALLTGASNSHRPSLRIVIATRRFTRSRSASFGVRAGGGPVDHLREPGSFVTAEIAGENVVVTPWLHSRAGADCGAPARTARSAGAWRSARSQVDGPLLVDQLGLDRVGAGRRRDWTLFSRPGTVTATPWLSSSG